MKRVFAWIVIFLIPLIIVLSRSYALPLVSAKTIVITEKEKITNPGMEIERITTIYIDYEGKCEVRHIHEKRIIKILDDQVDESDQVIIRKDGMVTSYDPEKKEGYTSKDPSISLQDIATWDITKNARSLKTNLFGRR